MVGGGCSRKTAHWWGPVQYAPWHGRHADDTHVCGLRDPSLCVLFWGGGVQPCEQYCREAVCVCVCVLGGGWGKGADSHVF
jgi:hypothetical protein